MSAIEIQNLHYAYPPLVSDGPAIPVLRGIDLRIERGEFVSLMGPTGSGKSTLCMALNGLVPQATGGVIRGQVTVLGRNPWRTPVAKMAAQVGMVYQDPESQLFAATVEDEVAFGPENLGVERQEIAERVDWALSTVNMGELRGRSPAQLSGGQKQRVAIAASLAMLPEVLVLDEPTASLDPVGQFEVFNVIDALCRERKMTIVMVSHDAEYVAQFSDRVAVLWQGHIARCDEPDCLFADSSLLRRAGLAAPQAAELAVRLNERLGTAYGFVRQEQAARVLGKELDERRSFGVVDTGDTAESRSFAALRMTKHCDSERDEGSRPPQAPPVVAVEGLTYHYEQIPALNGIDLTIAKGAYLAVVGQNGSGKTTLVKHLNGLLTPTTGAVRVYGQDTTEASVSSLARRVGFVFQNPDHQIFCATTREEIAFGPTNLGLGMAEVTERTREALELSGLTRYAEAPPAILGFGLRRKVAVASVCAMRPDLLVLDEPTSGLDRRSAEDLMGLVDRLHDEGHTIVVVTHDMQLVALHCSEMLVMHKGRVLLEGRTRDILCQTERLLGAQIRPPQIMRLAQDMGRGLPKDVLTVSEFTDAYEGRWRGAQR